MRYLDAFLFVKSSPSQVNSSLESHSRVSLPGDIHLYFQFLISLFPLLLLESSFFSMCAATFLRFPASVLSSDFCLSALVASAPCTNNHHLLRKCQFDHLPFLLWYWASPWYRREKKKTAAINLWFIITAGELFSVSAFCPHLRTSSSRVQPHVHALLLVNMGELLPPQPQSCPGACWILGCSQPGFAVASHCLLHVLTPL